MKRIANSAKKNAVKKFHFEILFSFYFVRYLTKLQTSPYTPLHSHFFQHPVTIPIPWGHTHSYSLSL